MTTTALLQVEEIPVERIQPSPTNPRKHYDQASLEELAASIKAVGVQVPLSLRMFAGADVEGKPYAYEIVGGERRWRAAQIAGLSSVPAICRVMTDAECREAQLVDNLQRADLSPMEEAEGYELLIREASAEGFAVTDEQLAAKVGKAAGHVRSRRKLLELIPEARAALAEGFLTFGCALLIAKLQPADQDKATIRALGNYGHSGDGTIASYLEDLRKEREENRKFRERAAAKGTELEAWEEEDEYRPMQERDLKEWIADNVTLDLAKANWPLDQPIEGVDAPPCQACPKRSGSDTALFAELTAKADVCTDPGCFADKRKAFVQITAATAKKSGAPLLKLSTKTGYGKIPLGAGLEKVKFKAGQWLEAKPGSCATVQRGITEEGQVLDVCVTPGCKVHQHHLISSQSRTSGGGGKADYEAERKKLEEARKAYVAKEQPIRMAVRAAILPKLKGALLLRAVAYALVRGRREYAGLAVLRGLPVKDWTANERSVTAAVEKAKDAELEGWLADALIAGGVIPYEHMHDELKRDREHLWAVGKLVGVDCDAIAKKLAPAPPAKPAAIAKGSAAAKAIHKAHPAAKKKAAKKPKAKKPAPAKKAVRK